MKVSVLGAGAWGSSLAKLLHESGNEVTLWAHNSKRLAKLAKTGISEPYLSGVQLPTDWNTEPNLEKAAAKAEVLVIAVASKAFRTVTAHLSSFDRLAVTCTKGIEFDTGFTMSSILEQTMPKAKIAAMSGPTLALEVANGVPAAIVAASKNEETAAAVQTLFHRPAFRVYTSDDVYGVEMGGALKNVIAIAAGIGDGLGFGDNSKAALLTRGIVETTRLGVAGGARTETFSGLSGIGDLTATCYSKLSRNRNFGERLGGGEQLPQILFDSANAAEGYHAACSAHQLAQKLKVPAPIINEVYAVLYEGKDARKAVMDLTRRDPGSERL
jgi:glycerol-3-phosphate dehydrogenase (NAD(P)+)